MLQLWGYFFGRKAMGYVFGVYGTTMVISVVIVEYAFGALNLIPQRPDAVELIQLDLTLEPKLVMTMQMLLLTSTLHGFLHRDRHRATERGEASEARDTFCGALVDPDSAVASRELDGMTLHFSSRSCAKAIDRNPRRFASLDEGVLIEPPRRDGWGFDPRHGPE